MLTIKNSFVYVTYLDTPKYLVTSSVNFVQFNESHIPGSPFPFLVGKMGADPALVMASGKGLTDAECGQ